jgi:hypothetical protein
MPLDAVHIQTQHGQAQAAGAHTCCAFTVRPEWMTLFKTP